MIYAVKGFAVINETKMNLLAVLHLSLHYPPQICYVISCASPLPEASLICRQLSLHCALHSFMYDFEQYFAGVRNQCYCAIVSTILGITFLEDGNEHRVLPVL